MALEFESDKDRLAIMIGCGAILVTVGGKEIYGLFDRQFVEAQGMSGNSPILQCRDVDLDGVVRGTSAVVKGKAYRVEVPEPDGTGMTYLPLEEV